MLRDLLATFSTSSDPATAFRLLDAVATTADAESLHEWLDATARPQFLLALPDRAARYRWADVALGAIRRSQYSLRTMLERRAAEHPERTLFEDRRDADTPLWSYLDVLQETRAMAAVFLETHPSPRVAIFCENSVDGAIADFACLTNGILVTPLNVHSDLDTLAWIIRRLDLNVALTDSEERQQRLETAAARSGRTIAVFHAGTRSERSLRQACARLDLDRRDALLAPRTIDITRPSTVMFTSGSTGQSKGLVFSDFMLTSKRFARAAALPMVGEDEMLLAYLPLFHTFGRYLEMLGMLFWHGTYVFAGNPSAESLLAQMREVRPTGLISIPLRWTQIREQALETKDLRAVVGDRLRWGLSAAGYLDPQVFRYFHRNGVDLCSGFGMTEATGGITMTPPGDYVDGSVGIPLPAIDTRLTDESELQISGAYVAAYLEGDEGLPSLDPDEPRWIATGDLFRRHEDGHFEIVDRIKDIYKNSRGQTVAPQRVEQQFTGVPGFRRTFLAGDHRDHNVLLIVPDRDDPVVRRRNARDYFARIVASVNATLPPYERVVNFALLDRDFAPGDELTPKGSLRRKTIEANFAPVIEHLYESSFVELSLRTLVVRVPRWLYRDLGIVEDDLVARGSRIVNRRNGASLLVEPSGERIRIGDLEYTAGNSAPLDLGLFARQPRLWLGNPSLAAFVPCKGGWDASLRDVSQRVRIARGRVRAVSDPRIEDDRLRELHGLTATALFGATAESLDAIQQLGEELTHAAPPLASAIRRRLEALAWRSEEPVRCAAYRTLILDVPLVDDESVFPAFIESGRSFLDSESIAAIASSKTTERRLQSLRQRLYSYRTTLDWPASPARRRQLRHVFRLLADYARLHREDFAVIQSELAAWALFDRDPLLARDADRLGNALAAWYDATLSSGTARRVDDSFRSRIVFEYGIAAEERASVERMLFDATFLRHSIASAFGDEAFDWDHVADEAVWVSPMLSHKQLRLYRVGINMVDGRHFDLLLVSGAFLRRRAVRDTILWLSALSGHAFGAPLLPRFGAWRRDLGAITVAYVSDLTAWDRVREMSSQFDAARGVPSSRRFRKIYVRAIAAFFAAWEQSGERIVPGALTLSNVALPGADFHERAQILSLTGWRPYDGPGSLVRPIVRNFYRLAEAHYPALREILDIDWIFEAVIEALGNERADAFFDGLAASGLLAEPLAEFRAKLADEPHVPLAVAAAIDRFHEWERMNPAASPDAREEAVVQMAELYRLHRFPEAFRYELYRRTWFARSGEAVDAAFERLIRRRLQDRKALTGHLDELSRLQGLLHDPGDRAVFSRMVFPQSRRSQKLELQSIGRADEKRVIVRSEIVDDAERRYAVREPVTASEVGHLYRLFAETDYPIAIAEHDRQFVVADAEDRIVGGLCYRWIEGGVVYVDGVVLARTLVHRGLGGRLLEDFAVRMAAEHARILQTNFFLGGLFTKHGFSVDERWGGLVRRVKSEG